MLHHRPLRAHTALLAAGFAALALTCCKSHQADLAEALDATIPCPTAAALQKPSCLDGLASATLSLNDRLGVDGSKLPSAIDPQAAVPEGPLDAADLGLASAGASLALTGNTTQTGGLIIALQPRLTQALARLSPVRAEQKITIHGPSQKGRWLSLSLSRALTNGKNLVYQGLSVFEAGGGKSLVQSIFAKFRQFGDHQGWDNPWAEWLANAAYQTVGGDLLEFVRPDVDYLNNTGHSYGHIDGIDVFEAVLIDNAGQDGKVIQPYPVFFEQDGKPKTSIELPLQGGGSRHFEVSQALRDALQRAVQNDQIFRYILGDVDGHMENYLIRCSIDGGVLQKVEVVAIDYGAMGLLAVGEEPPLREDQAVRRRLFSSAQSATADLFFGYRMPLPAQLTPALAAAFGRLKTQVDQWSLYQDANNPANARWRQQVKGRVDRVLAFYPTAAGAAGGSDRGDDRADAPDSDNNDEAHRSNDAGRSGGSRGR